jgi:predicted ATPase/DNA-binding SARP family transcriptional activator
VSEFRIFLFGYPRVECESAPVPIRRRKALALLAYLAATGSSHSRDVLAALLWPEHDASRAFAFLRNALWILNATPLSKWLVCTRHTIGLRHDPELKTDVVEFREAYGQCLSHEHANCEERLMRAVSTFNADFLEGFSIDDSEPFEDWQYSESAALRQELAASLESLVQAHEDRGDLEGAVRLVRRWVDVQPLNEVVHRRAMELLALAGQRGPALAQFETCRSTLQAELGLSPSEETETLAERIRRGEVVARPKPRSPEATPIRLPVFRTPLVGRESELARTVDLLRDGDCRLLTITGPGGAGKTRLAVAAASLAAGDFPDGVLFIPLVSTPTSTHVPLEIADVLGAFCAPDDMDQEAGSSTPGAFSDLLLARLKPRRLLLVLDNMEHLLADLRWVDTLLGAAPGVTLLVTSRQQLNLQDEWVLPIEGLPFPSEAVPNEVLPSYDAVSLFLQSARRANASFSPTDEDWEAISSTVRLLQGMPLGIELAAAWVRTMSCKTVASEIAKSLDFLSTSMPDVPKRHHSLRAVFEQSWSLLTGEARSIFRKLSVFRGSFNLGAASAVAGASLPVLSSLVAASLLRRTSPERFEMLEVLRQYAEERLLTMPEEHAELREAHAAFYLSLLAENEAALKSSDQRWASERILASVDNVRTAWRWASSFGRFDLLDRAAVGLFLYCDMRNAFDEAVDLFGEAAVAAKTSEAPVPLYALLRSFEGWFTRMRRGSRHSEPLFDESLRLLESQGMSRELGFVYLLWSFGGFGTAEERLARLTQSLTFFEETGSSWEAAEALEALAWARIETDREEALAYARKSVRIHESLNDPWGIAMARCTLGSLYTMAEEHEAARLQLEASLSLRQENDLDPLGAMQCIIELGYLAAHAGNWTEAGLRYSEALAIAEEKRARWAQASIHEWLASVCTKTDDQAEAVRHAKAARAIYEDFGRKTEAARCAALLDSVASPQPDEEAGEGVTAPTSAPHDPLERRARTAEDSARSSPDPSARQTTSPENTE